MNLHTSAAQRLQEAYNLEEAAFPRHPAAISHPIFDDSLPEHDDITLLGIDPLCPELCPVGQVSELLSDAERRNFLRPPVESLTAWEAFELVECALQVVGRAGILIYLRRRRWYEDRIDAPPESSSPSLEALATAREARS